MAPGANTDPNQPTEIRIFHGANGALLGSFAALGAWSGGAFVAAGDLNGDGRADIVVAADSGGGPHVRAYSGADLTGQTMLWEFHAYATTFGGGVRVALADVTGDGLADLITSQGANGDPTQPTQVRLFRGTDRALLARFDALGAWAGGASVAAGDMNADGRADIYVGGGVALAMVSCREGFWVPLAPPVRVLLSARGHWQSQWHPASFGKDQTSWWKKVNGDADLDTVHLNAHSIWPRRRRDQNSRRLHFSARGSIRLRP